MQTTTTAPTDMSVPMVIRKQLGDSAMYMIGAKMFAGDAKSLHFRFTTSRITNYVKITLRNDLYDMEFLKIRGTNFKNVALVEGVYFDQMLKVIERIAKVYTSL